MNPQTTPHLSRAEFCSGEIFFQMANDRTDPEGQQAFIRAVVATKRMADAELAAQASGTNGSFTVGDLTDQERKKFMFGADTLGCEGSVPKAAAPVLSLASAHLALETTRRGSDGTMDISPSRDPDDDYAASLNFLAMGLRHLEEGLPNAQMPRVRMAFLAMERGMEIMKRFLAERKVM